MKRARLAIAATLPTLLSSCVVAPIFLGGNQETDPSGTTWWESSPETEWVEDTGEYTPTPRTFDAYAVFISAHTAWYGEELEGFPLFANDSSSWQDPYIDILIVEEDYFDNWNGTDHACRWTGTLEVLGDADFSTSADPDTASMWHAHEVRTTLLETDCENFSERMWGDTTPTKRLEEITFAVGYGPMSSTMRSALREVVLTSGGSWSDYAPYYFSTWFAFDQRTDGWAGDEVDPTTTFTLGEEGGLVYDANGEAIMEEISSGEPPFGYYASQGWWGFLATEIAY